MAEILETPEQQVAVIEANVLKICELADSGYKGNGRKRHRRFACGSSTIIPQPWKTGSLNIAPSSTIDDILSGLEADQAAGNDHSLQPRSFGGLHLPLPQRHPHQLPLF